MLGLLTDSVDFARACCCCSAFLQEKEKRTSKMAGRGHMRYLTGFFINFSFFTYTICKKESVIPKIQE
jgi:hypothetical protein